MADDEHRAVAEALNAHLSGSGDWSKATPAMAEVAIAALDRVRVARGDDETVRLDEHGFALGHAPDCGLFGDAECTCYKRRTARSPQGEDHEAGIEAARQALCSGEVDFSPPSFGGDRRKAAEVAIAAYLARVSPFRGDRGDDEAQDAAAYHRVCDALWPYWSQQESMTAEEAVKRLVLAARSPHAEGSTDNPTDKPSLQYARSPQGEDHEA